MSEIQTFITYFCALVFSSTVCFGQEKKIVEINKVFQVSLFPGMGTNGIYSERYSNDFSLNIFSGLASSNRVLEIGLVSNSNLNTSTGIQIAGLANMIGTNRSLYELKNKNDKTEQADFRGMMVSGFLNYVKDNSSGFGATIGFNLIGENFSGFQFAGLANAAGGTGKGIQIAGIFNNSLVSFAGFQLAALLNSTTGPLSGTQIALVNRAGSLVGRKTSPTSYGSSAQIGLCNFSNRQDGWQIGLINFSKEFGGKQIGVINFFNKKAFKDERRGGTPIGLLNFGSKGSYLRIYPNELFFTNIEFSTGNCINCTLTPSGMPYHESYRKFNQNIISFGFDAQTQLWACGYGFQRMLYNKAGMKPSDGNQKRFIAYGVKLQHFSKKQKWDTNFNLLSSLNVDIGRRILGRSPFFLFAGMSLNYLIIPQNEEIADYQIKSKTINIGSINNMQGYLWVGYRVGIQLASRPESNL